MLVSNIGQTVSAGSGFEDDFALGQAFSVGADGGDYTLTSIEIPISSFSIAATDIGLLSVSVWSATSSGHPSSSLHTLMNPESIAAGTTAMFNAQAGAALEAGKTYVVVVYYDKNLPSQPPSWVYTGTGEDADPATGWVIADSRLFRASSGTTWSDFTGAGAYKIRVNGTAVSDTPTPTGFEAAVGDAQVTLSWDTPPTGVTGHEYRYKTGAGSYPASFTSIANSGVGGTNAASFTVTGLTNEIAHTFELRAVNAAGDSDAAESDAVTPTPGICDRTDEVHEAIVYYLGERNVERTCAEVNVADLESFVFLEIPDGGITSLKAGDFAGLTKVLTLTLARNMFTTLPAGVFTSLTALNTLNLNGGELSSLPANVFTGLPALKSLNLTENDLDPLDAGTFTGLTALQVLGLNNNELVSLPAGVFGGLTALHTLNLNNNGLVSLPAGVFGGLTALINLNLYQTKLASLPAGVFGGLTALAHLALNDNDLDSLDAGTFTGLTALGGLGTLKLGNNPNTGDVLPLTVTVEKVGTDQARAKVLAGAPFDVEFTPTVVNGSLPASDTKLAVPTGAVDGTAVTVTRTSGTMAAVTVDIDLSTQPTLPTNHTGYTFAKATGSEPVEILPDTRGPQNLTAAPGDGQAVLAWDAPPSGSGVTKHQYHFKTTGGSYPTSWTDIPNSAVGEANEDGYTVPNLTNETAYTFELRWLVGASGSATAESNTVTPTPGICDRTQKVYEAIVEFYVAGTDNCAAVTVADLAAITELDLSDLSIDSLKSGDLAGLTNVVSIGLTDNRLTTLPEDVFSGLTTLRNLRLDQNDLTSLPAGLFTGLTSLESIQLQDNDLTSLPDGVFTGLTAMTAVNLISNDLMSLPDGVFTGLTSLGQIALQDNNLTSLPAGVFTGLTSLEHLSLGGNPDNGDRLPLTVTLEKVGDDGVRAKVLAAAPFAVDFTATVANGTLDGNATVLSVPKGSVESSAVTVTRTEGTTDAVTVDIDLTTQPALPSSHTGYEFARSSDLPVEILPEEATIDPPTDFNAASGADQEAVLSWTPPAASSGYTRHEYRYQAGNGSFTAWTAIPDSGPGGASASGFTVTGLGGRVEHLFELRAASDDGRSRALTARVTPTGGAVVTLHLSDNEPHEDLLAVTVTATASPASPVAFTVEISASPVAPATDDDFELSTNRTLSFAANATGSTGTVRISPVSDEDPEPNDVVTVSGVVSNPAIPNPDDVTLTILNDDADLPQDIAIDAPAAVDEGAGTANVTVTMTTRQNTAPVIDAQLFYRQRPGTATRGDDYTRPQSLGNRIAIVPVSAFSANADGTAWVARHSFEIGIVDDGEAERDETIVFEIYSISDNRGIEQTIVIRDDDAIAPGRPTGLTAFPKSQTRIQLAWTAPEDHGSFAITGYKVEASEDAGSSWNAVARTRDARTDFPHGGLSAGDTRHYRVSAVSDGGASAPSNVASATTVSAGPAATNPNLPPPADVTAAPKLPGQIRLGWWTPLAGGGQIDEYKYRRRAADTSDWTNWKTVNKAAAAFHSRFVDELDVGTTYEFQVRSVDRNDRYSETVSALATATGRPTISIARDTRSVEEGDPLRFTLSRGQSHAHGRLYVILQISETEDMLSPEGRRPNGLWTKGVYFGDGNATVQVVLETVDDGDADEPNSRVKVEVMPYPLYPGNPENEDLYSVDESRGSATATVTASGASSSQRSLQGRFVSPPARHDGEKRIKVRVAFSEPVAESPRNVGEHGVDVEGGEVTSVSPVGGNAPGGAGTRSKSRSIGNRNAGQQDREVVWEFEIEPDSDGDVTVSIEAGRPCDEEGAICTPDGRSLSEDISTTVEGPDEGPPPLTASFTGLPETHDGESAFTFRIAFSERVGWMNGRRLREDVVAVSGGRATAAGRVDRRRDLWQVTVEPDSTADVTVTLSSGAACRTPAAVCTSDGRALSNTISTTVAGPDVAPANTPAEGAPAIAGEARVGGTLTASTSGITDADGLENATFAYQWIRGGAEIPGATGSDYTAVDADEGERLQVRVGFADDAGNAESLTSAATQRVAARALPKVLAADARAREGEDATLDFAVTLSAPAPGLVTVDYRTLDASAKAGEDYEARSGTLSFAPGETAKTVAVPVLDDALDEGTEILVLRLENVRGAVLADRFAVGRIENSDPLQRMWLSRFGRTVAGQVTDAVSDRLANPLTGAQVTVGGQRVDLAAAKDEAWVGEALTSVARALGASERREPGAGPGSGFPGSGPGQAGAGGWPATGLGRVQTAAPGSTPAREVTGRELLLGSAFHLAREGDGTAPGLAAWGRVTVGGFDGEAPADGGNVRIDGEVVTGILGADAEWNRLLAGVAISVSEGEGTFAQPDMDSGTIESTMTVVSPYARLALTERVSVWGLAGWGTGDMTIVQAANDRGQPERVTRTDLEMRLAAVGGRGALLEADEAGGIDLALKADAFYVETESEAVSNEGSTTGVASRVRVALEGGRAFDMGNGATLRPSLELGLRHDGGDAETGTGVEIGGGVSYADPASGLSVEAKARMLVAHADSDYREWGASASVRLAPGERGRGLSFALSPTLGAAGSGAARLWGARDAGGLAPGGAGGFEASRGLNAELGYGLSLFGDRFTGTPNVGFALSNGGARDYRIGWRLTSAVRGDPGFEVNLDATRREAANGNEPPGHGAMLRAAIKW